MASQESASARLRRAREAHEALRRSTPVVLEDEALPPIPPVSETAPPSPTASASVADLASQLQSLVRRDSSGTSSDASPRPWPNACAALAKVEAGDKDQLLLHLLRQCEALRRQRDEAAALGEGIAAQLVRQQHELREASRQRVDELERALHRAQHAHPEVAALSARVAQLSDANRELEQQLRFSGLELEQSRTRERELKRLHDLLWDV